MEARKTYTTQDIESLIKEHGAYMLYFIEKMLKFDQVLSKDLYQDALMKIFLALKAGKFNPDTGTEFSWMIIVCKNIVIDHFRRIKKNPAAPNTDAFNEDVTDDNPRFLNVVRRIIVDQDAGNQDRDNKIEKDIQFNVVIDAILNMKNRLRRDALYYKYVLGYKGRDAAEKLGITEIAFRTRVFHGKAKLKQMLIDQNVIAA